MFRFTVIICSIFFITSCTLGDPSVSRSSTTRSPSATYATGLTEDQRIALAHDRQKEIRTIRKGDYLILQKNAIEAISYYIQALEKLPDDIVIQKKIAHAYFLAKDWKSAYQYYASIPLTEIRDDEQRELFQALFFDTDRQDHTIEVGKYVLTTPTREYYDTITTCLSGIHNCIVSIESYSGTSQQILGLQKTIQQSSALSPDFQYRNFLVATEFYKLGEYSITAILSAEILTNRPNYFEVRKLRGFALYELGRYTESREQLYSYIEKRPKDIESILRLADIESQLGNHTNAILYYNNAIIAGTKNKSDIERRLAREYARIGDHASMLKVLSYLINEPDVSERDLAVAISIALESGENTKAYMWSYTAMQQFSQSRILTPLYMRSLRVNGRSLEVINVFHELNEERTTDPLTIIEYAQSLIALSRGSEALPLLGAIRDSSPDSEWGLLAGELMQGIE